MKILITTDWYEPIVNGVVTSVLNLKRELEARGHEVKVLTLSETGASYKYNEVYYVKSMDLGYIYPNARAVLPYRNPYVGELIDWEPDVVHSQCEFMTFQYAVKISKKCGCPLLHTYHTIYEDYMHYLPGMLGRYTAGRKAGKKAVAEFSRTVLNKTDRVIAPTGKVKDILSTYEVKPEVDVIPSGIDLSKFKRTLTQEEKNLRKEALGIPKQNRVLVSVGRLAKEKNLEEILEYFARLLEEGAENMTLLIAGDGPNREDLQNLSISGGDEPQVYSYTQQGEDWEKTEEAWVEERIDADTYVNYLLRGADENLYLMTTDIVDTGESDQTTSADGEFVLPPQPTYLYRHTPEGETQEVVLECMDLEYQKQNGGFVPYYLGVVESGDIAVVGAATTNIILYDGVTGKESIHCRVIRS